MLKFADVRDTDAFLLLSMRSCVRMCPLLILLQEGIVHSCFSSGICIQTEPLLSKEQIVCDKDETMDVKVLCEL